MDQALVSSLALSPQHQQFVDLVLGGMSAISAARACGYATPETYAVRLTKLPQIAAAIAAGRRGSASRLNITRDDVLQGFLDATRMAADATELVGAWREIAKMQGMYAPETKVVVHEKQGAARRSQLEALPEPELIKMVGLDPGIIDAEYTMLPEPGSEEPNDGHEDRGAEAAEDLQALQGTADVDELAREVDPLP